MESDRVLSSILQVLIKAHRKRIIRIVCSGGGAKGIVYPILQGRDSLDFVLLKKP